MQGPLTDNQHQADDATNSGHAPADRYGKDTEMRRASAPPPPRRRWPMILVIVFALSGLSLMGLRALDYYAHPEVENELRGPTVGVRESGAAAGTETATPELRGSLTDMFLEINPDSLEHPLDGALMVAEAGLAFVQENIRDYTATLVKRERIRGRLGEEEYLFCKVRHADEAADVPFSVYIRYLKPRRMAGRQAVFVEGQNSGNVIANDGGLLRGVRVTIKPDSVLAMRGQRYPITELGIENLIVRMLDRGENAKQDPDAQLSIDRDVTIDGASCTLIVLTHPQKKPGLEFHIAKIYINDELNVPIGYQGYLWPENPGGEPLLLESYFYTDLKLNVGLTDEDFSPDRIGS